MAKVRVNAFTVSIGGCGAGAEQSLDHPLGHGGERLHQWMIGTKTFIKMDGTSAAHALIDELHLAISPTILGRGEALLTGFDMAALGFQVAEQAASEHGLHVVLRKA